ncbi:MAG: amidohydrolase family protein [Candidatus Geothermarchaeales archaeon]
MATTIVKNAVVLTMNQRNEIIENGSIVIEGTEIRDVGPISDIAKKYAAEKEIDASGMVAMPGLINGHNHLCVPPPRATYDDKDIMQYFLEIYAMANKFTEDVVYKLSLLSGLEALQSGTTYINSYGHLTQSLEEAEIRALEELGLRAMVCTWMQDIMHPLRMGREEQLEQAATLAERYSSRERIRFALGPTAIDEGEIATTREFLRGIAAIAKENNLRVHTHAIGAAGEKDIPLGMWQELGLVNCNMIAVHCLGAGRENIKAFGKHGVSVVHCPAVWAKMGRHHAPWIPLREMMKQGINVSLGTDGPGLNSHSDMFREMRDCGLLNNFTSMKPWLSQDDILRMATINGAKTLGMEKEVGSLEPGKRADVILVDLNKPHLRPLNNVVGLMVYAATGQDVDTVIINGKVVMEKRKVLGVDEARVMNDAKEAFDELHEAAGWKTSLSVAAKPKTPVFLRLPNKAQMMKAMVKWAGKRLLGGLVGR